MHGSKTESPLQYFKGVGPARAQILARMGIRRVADLLAYFPRAWEDRRLRFTIREAPMGEKTTLTGTLRTIDFSTTRSRLGLASASLEDETGKIEAIWFKRLNPRYDVFSSLRRQLEPGRQVYVFGTLEWGPEGRQIRVEDFAVCAEGKKDLAGEDLFHFGRIVPLYTVPEELPERLLRALIARALEQKPLPIEEILPDWLRRKKEWIRRAEAIARLHFPQTLIEKERARETLAFEEFLILETALARVRRWIKRLGKSHHYALKRHLLTPFREQLSFEFTPAQKRVIREIFDDLMKAEPMHRLLQGDVGSGKTVVALSAMLLAVENGGQAALMAPTEILAEQHARVFARMLKGLPVRIAHLAGSQTAAQKKRTLAQIAAGGVDVVIGTHALIQKHVRFHRLMLAVIDEQHRFGVEHRSLLREKGASPDILVMTATPIPRTLALTLYGDLDVSTLEGLPPGRAPITTKHVTEDEAVAFIRKAVGEGRQAYVVYPLVSESDKVELKAAVQEALLLKSTVFKDLRVGVLHGQLPGRQKDAIMEEFRKGRIDVLVATTIIEVGIDVPNACVMVVQHAERFGLATLHQLRGRIGRGAWPSTCLLVGDARGEEAGRRLRIMTETTDGFKISEEDLALRGPGEVLGALQHGLPAFKLGHLIRDARLIQEARQAADEILQKDPRLQAAEHRALRQALEAQWASKWPMGITG